MKGLLLATLLATAMMTSTCPQGPMPTSSEEPIIVNAEESMDIQTQIQELLQTDDVHAMQALKELSQIDLTPDEILGVTQLDNGYFQMTFKHDGKCFTAELTRKKYIDSVTDENGELVFAEIY